MELNRVGAGAPGPKTREMFDLARPEIDFVALARSLGVPASSATTADEFAVQLEASLSEPGPHLIEVVNPAMF